MKERGVEWTYHVDRPSLRLLDEQPGHGCDTCSRFRRRAVYQIARELGANVIGLRPHPDDVCEAFLRNAMFNGRLSALPPVVWSRQRDFRLIPAVVGDEDLTRAFAESTGAPSYLRLLSKDRTVRRSLRDFLENGKRIPPTEDNPAESHGQRRTLRCSTRHSSTRLCGRIGVGQVVTES